MTAGGETRQARTSAARGTRSRSLAVAAVLCLFLASGCEQEVTLFGGGEGGRELRPEPPPNALNVILITLDTTRADALGSYGQMLGATPHLDAMADDGVLFEQVSSAAPTTLPSHASLFTGTFPFVHGARANANFAVSEENETLAEVVWRAGYHTAAEVAASVLGRQTGLGQGFDFYRDMRTPGVRNHLVTVMRDEKMVEMLLPERGATQITDAAADFLSRNRKRAFFLWLHYFDPHMFYAAPPLFHQRQPHSPYHAEIMYVDYEISRLLSEIERLGLREKTLVVVTADHGEGLNEHGEETHGLFLYETTVRAPLLFWGPEFLPRGKRVTSLVRTVDIAPTILDFMELPPLEAAQGVSLRPLIEGKREDLELAAYSETAEGRLYFGASLLRSLRRGQWKYIHKPNPELFDLEADPGESRNLISEESEKAAELRSELEELLAQAPGARVFAEVEVDEQIRSQLRALGYLSGDGSADIYDGPGSLALSGPDHRDLADDFSLLARAVAHREVGDFEAALVDLRQVRERHPESQPVLMETVYVLRTLGRLGEAAPLLYRAIELDPDYERAYRELAMLLTIERDFEALEELMDRLLEQDGCNELAIHQLARLRHRRGEHVEEHRIMSEALDRCEVSATLRNNFAYFLATTPEDSLRSGLKAISIAEEVVAENPDQAIYRDTLAAAYAEAGDFEAAVQMEEIAIAILREKNASREMIRQLEDHLILFEQRKPIREVPPPLEEEPASP